MNRNTERYSDEMVERAPQNRGVIARVASQIHAWLAGRKSAAGVKPGSLGEERRTTPRRVVEAASMSLELALTKLCEESLLGGSIRFRIFVSGQPKKLSPEIQEQIYLVGREAMLNAWRHAQATTIEAEIEYLRRGVRLAVRDNGRGIDPRVVESGHWGLLAMRDRAVSIGAILKISSKPGAGTEVEISAPGDFLVEACA
jgi:nitrate/nitrite-specific signal transduction histidine kinase